MPFSNAELNDKVKSLPFSNAELNNKVKSLPFSPTELGQEFTRTCPEHFQKLISNTITSRRSSAFHLQYAHRNSFSTTTPSHLSVCVTEILGVVRFLIKVVLLLPFLHCLSSFYTGYRKSLFEHFIQCFLFTAAVKEGGIAALVCISFFFFFFLFPFLLLSFVAFSFFLMIFFRLFLLLFSFLSFCFRYKKL